MIHVVPNVEAAKSAFHTLGDQEDQFHEIRAYLTAIDAMAEQVEDKPLAGAIQVVADQARRLLDEAEAGRAEAMSALHPIVYPDQARRSAA